MKKLFPRMYDHPEASTIVTSAMYWFVCYVLIPFVTTVILIGSYGNTGLVSGFDLGYYTLNFLAMAAIFRQYIMDSFLTVQINTRNFIITTLVAAVIIVVLVIHTVFFGYVLDMPMAFSVYPVTETSVLTTSAVAILKHPIAGTVCTVLLAPVTVSCIFYSTVFAPICCNRPWLAYLVMAVTLFIPRLFNIWWLGDMEYELWTYFLHLPIHMLACWSYQKTDTVWTPIAVLALSNLASCGLILMLGNWGLIWVN